MMNAVCFGDLAVAVTTLPPLQTQAAAAQKQQAETCSRCRCSPSSFVHATNRRARCVQLPVGCARSAHYGLPFSKQVSPPPPPPCPSSAPTPCPHIRHSSVYVSSCSNGIRVASVAASTAMFVQLMDSSSGTASPRQWILNKRRTGCFVHSIEMAEYKHRDQSMHHNEPVFVFWLN